MVGRRHRSHRRGGDRGIPASFDFCITYLRRAGGAALIGAGALTCADALEPERVIPIAIAATPDLDTLRMRDSLIFTVWGEGDLPTDVVWTIEPRGDSVLAHSLIYRPRAAGTEYVRARARFSRQRIGTAVRPVVTLPNAAPVVALTVVDGALGRVPLGDTITLVAAVTDADADPIPRDARRWFLGFPDDGRTPTALGSGDTLQYVVTGAQQLDFYFRVTDPVGAYADARYTTTAYGPVTPWRWRLRVHTGWVTGVSRHPGGLILIDPVTLLRDPTNGLPPSGVRALGALSDAGETVWVADSTLATYPIVGDDGAIYQGAGPLLKRNADGSLAWSLASAAAHFAPVLLQDGAVVIPRATSIVVIEPDGTERWSTPVDSTRGLSGVAVGTDSLLYVVGGASGSTSEATVASYTPDGQRLWQVFLGPNTTSGTVVPADDSTLLVGGRSLFALRRDGSVRWFRDEQFRRPAVANGRVHYVSAGQMVTVALDSGAEIWRTSLPGWVSWGGIAPVVTSAGETIVNAGRTVIAFDSETGAERWRHELSGEVMSDLLLTEGGDLIALDAQGFVEAIAVGAGPAAGPWPMGMADEGRTGRARRP